MIYRDQLKARVKVAIGSDNGRIIDLNDSHIEVTFDGDGKRKR